MLVTGPNGAGKTNLLESLHVGTQGFSPRTRADAQLVRFGREAARVALRGSRAGVPLELEVTLELGSGKRATLNGAKLRAAEQLRGEVTTLVFTPDRLVVVKGGPAARRAYFDRVLGRLAPSRAGLSAEYGAAVGQRNAALRRVAQGVSSREALAPWNEQVSTLGGRARRRPARDGRRAAAGASPSGPASWACPQAELRYEGEAPSVEELERRLDRDLERGATGVGPAPRRPRRALGRPRPARVRLAGRAAPGRARAAARRGRAARGAPRHAPAAPARRRALGARPGPPADPRRPRSRLGAGARSRARAAARCPASRPRRSRSRSATTARARSRDGAARRRGQARALPLRRRGVDDRARRPRGRPPSARPWPRTPGRPGWPATGRCT